jgi:hypothetical protein
VAFLNAISDGSAGYYYITESELETLTSAPPTGMTAADVFTFVERWNHSR